MRLFILAIACVLVVWALWPRQSALTPSAQVPTFEQSRADSRVLEAAASSGTLREDPGRRELRQAVLTAGNRLENSPCDKTVQLALRKATSELMANLIRTRDEPIETYTIDGRVVNATGFLNTAAITVMREAQSSGVLRPGDMRGKPVAPDAPLPPPSEDGFAGRYACRAN